MAPEVRSVAETAPEERRRRLTQLLKQRTEAGRTFPLSFAQERLWLLDRLEPDSPVYNIPLAVRLSGALDLDALCRTMQAIVTRHESLRTRFSLTGDQPVQVIEPAQPRPLPIVDLEAVAPEMRESEAMTRASAEARRPFRLEDGSLFRVLLLRLSAQEHILVVVLHHIISDDWSMAVLFRDVAALYEAFVEGRPCALENVPVHYADYAVWQRDRLRGGDFQRQLDYWRNRLDALHTLELPTDRVRPRHGGREGSTATALLPPTLVHALRDVGRREGATLFMALLAAFHALLCRHSGQTDIAIGAPVAGRLRAELEPVVGFFVNTLVMRVDLAGSPSFRDLLRQVRRVALEAFQNQELPFERLVEALNPPRDPSRHPLFQVALTLQSAPWPDVRLQTLRMSPIPLETGCARFDLWLSVRETGEGLNCALEYRRDLFDADTTRRMLEHFRVLLEGVVAQPDRPVSLLPLLTEGENRQLLVEWNETGRDFASDSCLHALVEAQVARTPDAVALVAEDRTLTYREMNERANRLAHRLARFGVGPDVAVGVCLERSADMVVSLLAILKAGGAYAPLDPDYPPERLGFMIRDSRPAAVLTTRALAARLPAADVRAVCLDDSAEPLGLEAAANPAGRNGPDDVAYVIYTSGSTGEPKGVRNTHRGICNRLLWMQDEYRLTAADCVLQKTPFSFDVSVWEFFWPLLTGARLVLARPGGHRDPRYLARLIAEQQVTTVHFVPSMLRVFLDEGETDACRCLKRVICSGEALPYDLLQRFFARLGAAELHNLYGPTEAAVDVTAWRCRTNERGLVPIGRPIANVQCYILDQHLNPVPIGVAGELYLGGVQLARDYVDRPELTAERFIPNPFCRQPQARLYKTGDVCRYLPDGNIQYLGRLDGQVKIRGNRVEMGEIQAVLLKHTQVREAVVTALDDASGSKQLVAYVVAEGACPGAAELREFLKPELPDYMIPTVFVPLKAIPLNVNGKVDYKALPRPVATRDERTAYVAPRTTDEEVLADIWSEVLRVERVGVHDNFFALGGHSLLAAQVTSRVARRLQVELPLRDMFQIPTVAELALRVTELRSRGRAGRREPIPVAPRDGRLQPSFTQEALWFLDQLERDRPTYTVYPTVRLKGPLDVPTLERALNEIIRRHESLRTRFPEVDGRPVQVIDPPTVHALSLADLSGLSEEDRQPELARHVDRQMQQPIDLQNGPLIRVTLVRLSADEHVVAAAAHHMIYDGWSLGVFTRELTVLYTAYRAGRPSPLPELPIQYADFAAWQRQVLQGESLARLRAYWVQQLGGVSPLQLPTDYRRPTVRTTRGATQPCDLSPELSAAVREFCRREGVTPFMTLLAALQVLLSRYSGQRDIAVGSPVANRLQPETESLIGYFVNVVVLRTDLSGEPSFRDVLQRVRQVALDAYDHQEMTFDQVVDALKPPRDLGRHPVFQAMFALLNAEPPTAGGGLGLEATPYESTPRTPSAYFDLTLELVETEEGFRGGLNFSTDLFRPETIERMARHFRGLLAAALADPGRPVTALPIITDAERQQVLVEWNNTQAGYDPAVTVPRRIEAQAAARPEAVAVVHGDRRWTYRELNDRANRLARFLLRRGVAPETRIGISLDRSPELVMAVLAILKAGGAYVPLDTAFARGAAERMAFIIGESQAAVIVTDRANAPSLPAGPALHVVLDGEHEAGIRAESDNNLDPGPDAANLAYVLYTSGSTGRPKGVMVTHRNLLNAYCGWESAYGLGTGAAAHLQMASFSFDVFAGDFARALCSGGALVICPTEDLLEADRLLALIRSENVGVAEFVPPVLRNLVQYLEASGQTLDSLRLAIVGSDVWHVEDHRRARRVLGPQTRLVNSYGLTEATIDSSWFEGDISSLPASAIVPIGRPFANTRLYVLDEHRQPLPVGVPGELYVAGDGVARGYVDAHLDLGRFLPDPFAPIEGARMYRTGDRARRQTDGLVEFLGRVDDQVKIRGLRIEPGETEEALRRHPRLAQVAVAVRERPPHGPHLVAYVVGRDGTAPPADEMRAFLHGRLPSYMIPGAFVEMGALPMTVSGKVDRKVLPEPDWGQAPGRSEFVAPRTAAERQLAAIWRDVLHLESVGARDDFFDRGGNSLLAMRLVSRVRDDLRVELPLAEVFLAPRLDSLAGRIEALQALGCPADATPIRPRRSPGPVPISITQERYWAMQQRFPGEPLLHIHATLFVRGPLDLAAVKESLNELVRRHDSLRTTFSAGGGAVPVQTVAETATPDLPIEDLSAVPKSRRREEVRRRSGEHARAPFDLLRGPLFRVKLLRLDPAEHVLLATMHHLVSDGWSVDVLVREVAQMYGAFSAGHQALLPALPIQYADYAVWQRERFQSPDPIPALEYWQEKLKGLERLRLPTRQPRLAGGTYEGRDHWFRVPMELHESLTRIARSQGVTPFMLYLAGYQAWLHRFTGATDIGVISNVANRARIETQGLIGAFTNMVVFRGDLTGDPAFLDLLPRMRQTVLEAYDRQDVPLECLVQTMEPGHDWSTFPFATVGFNYQQRLNAASLDRRPELDLEFLPTPTPATVVRSEMWLTLSEDGEGLHGEWTYRRSLFEDEEAIERLTGRFVALLGQIGDDPSRRLSSLTGVLDDPASGNPAAPKAAAPGARRPRPSRRNVPSGMPDAAWLSDLLLRSDEAHRGHAQAPVLLRAGDGSPPLFLVPGLGGGVAPFLPLVRELRAARPVFGLPASGLLPGETPHLRIEDMAERCLRQIRSVRSSGACAVCGWSLGGLIALETARQSRESDGGVGLVVLLDTDLGVGEFGALAGNEEDIARRIGSYLRIPPEPFRGLTPEQQWERIARDVAAHARANEEDVRRVVALCRAQQVAVGRYQPRPFDGPVVLLRARRSRGRADRRWAELCARLHVERVSGDHYSMLRPPHITVLAERLEHHTSRCLGLAHDCCREPTEGRSDVIADADVPRERKRP